MSDRSERSERGDHEKRFHEQWLGMVQPSEGLVVSVPVLCDAQCMEKLPRELHVRFLGHLVDGRIRDLRALFADVLELDDTRFDDDPPREVSLYVAEGKQLLRPTRALKATRPSEPAGAEATPASKAGAPYAMLVWEVPPEIEKLDKPEALTGTWDYPAQAKFERLLRECRVPIGLLSNGRELRLVYAPHGESSGWIAFRVDDMATVSGRPIFDALVMLLSRKRWFGVAAEHQLPAILAESRRRNADVTNDLSRQVFEALEVLLAGFAAADERDGKGLLRDALEREDEHLYAGLLTVLLRLVFLLYCEDRALLPVDHEIFEEHYSLLGLFEQLQGDHGRFPDTMHRRFGAWPRLVSLFRAVFLGVKHGELRIPARRGELFDPNTYPFLEGWGPEGGAPIAEPEARAEVVVPSVDDLTVYRVLHQLLYLGGQRLSYKALDVEQIGSVYEALMGFRIERLEHAAVRIKLGSKRGAARVWVEPARVLALPKGERKSHLEDELGFDKAIAKKIGDALEAKGDPLVALEPLSGRVPERAAAGTLVVQPGPERRRTSSHYTPRELTEPIVARTLEPLIQAMGEAPSSQTLLDLVICDPAMGSGAFLVAACRYLADHVVAAWTREGALSKIADAHDDVVNHARRLVAQRCLYGVDKNPYAVRLARLSLWLVTMAREEPFTFVDHALRHGDSLVGLSFDQLRAFHWKPGAQVEISAGLLNEALDEAIAIRRKILDLAAEGTFAAQQEKEWLLFNANDLLDRVRLIGDLVVGAFFAHGKDKDREKERDRRLALVERWLAAEKRGDAEAATGVLDDLRAMQAELWKTQVPFHWMIEFPEVFTAARKDPLAPDEPNGVAFVDAFVGNPPFASKNGVVALGGREYVPWLLQTYDGSHGNADLCAYFFRRAGELLGTHGCIGFVATNTISQGDTRTTGLSRLVAGGAAILSATSDVPWAGDAAVIVSIVVLAVGRASAGKARLNGNVVAAIDSRLRAAAERADARPLASMGDLFFMGSKVYGAGFFLTPPEAAELLQDPCYQSVIFPAIAGEDINTHPTQAAPDFVISFGQHTLADAEERWPRAFRIVRERVKPERDRANELTADGAHRKKYWWQHAQPRPELYAAIRGLSRCLVTSRVSKHLLFSFQPTNRIFSDGIFAFPFETSSAFAILQSRIHEPWARLLSSSMKTDLRYVASDCFETFPFPHENPRDVIPELEAVGERLYEARARYMVEENVGLTKTYNALKDPACEDARILELRALHEDMDRAVLAAYGWSDLPVPPYCPKTDEDRAALKSFEESVIDRLFALNAERAEKERAHSPAPKTKKPAKKPAAKKPTSPALPGFDDD